MTKEELLLYFKDVEQVDGSAPDLLKKYPSIASVEKYYLPEGCSPSSVYIVTVHCGDSIGRRVPREDFGLSNNQACEGEWLCHEHGGWWRIFTDEEVKNMTKADIIKLYMTEIKIPLGYTIPQALALFLEEMKKDSGRSYYGQYHGIDLFSGDTVDMAVERLKGERKVV